jgi:hypothetical protein
MVRKKISIDRVSARGGMGDGNFCSGFENLITCLKCNLEAELIILMWELFPP